MMLTMDVVKQISQKISLANGVPDDDLSEDISEIVYRVDVFECGDDPVVDRHVDIEYSFGDYLEVHEDDPVFAFICGLCSLPLAEEEQEIVLYQNDEE